MTTTAKDHTTVTDDARVIPLGWVVVLPGGDLAIDPDTEESTFATEADANAAAAELAHDVELWGLGRLGALLRVVRAADYTAPRTALPAAHLAVSEIETIEYLGHRYPAPPTRTTTEYALRLVDGSLYRDTDTLTEGQARTHTAYTDRADADAAADAVARQAEARGVRGARPLVVSRTYTTTATEWDLDRC